MKNTSTYDDLSRQIEQLVQVHLAGVRTEAEAAIARAFTSSMPVGSTQTKKTRSSTISKRRSRQELEATGERLLELVQQSPGESMAVLAPKLGLSPRELLRPMALLKEAGRVRSAGQRHLTRYFPLI